MPAVGSVQPLRQTSAAAGSAEATGAGIALDQVNPRYATTPPYGAANYKREHERAVLHAGARTEGRNIRLSADGWHPQLNSPHTGWATCLRTFLGDYSGILSVNGVLCTTSVRTYDDGTNPQH